MASTPAYEVNQEIIIAPGPSGNKLEIAERGQCVKILMISMDFTTGTGSRRMLKKTVQQGRSR
jgi:hypothetical protein